MKHLTKRVGFELLKIVLTTIVIVLFFAAFTAIASAATIYVPDDYGTIQGAVDNATAGDTIVVRDGTYNENVDVTKSDLTIRSENGPSVTTVSASLYPNKHVFKISHQTNVTLKGFEIRDAHGTSQDVAGIHMNNAWECNISDNIVTNISTTGYHNAFGIWLDSSSDNSFHTTTVYNLSANHGAYGISLYSSSDNNSFHTSTVYNLSSARYAYGIRLYSSSANLFNTSTTVYNLASANSNAYGIWLYSSNGNSFSSGSISDINAPTWWDFYSDKDSHGNSAEDITISSFPTTISFTYDNGIKLKSMDTPPADPSGKRNISKYVNATEVTAGSWIFMNVSYEEGDLVGVDENSLRMWKHNGTDWTEVPGTNGVNTAENYVYANIMEFSVFAPLGNVTGVKLEINKTCVPDPVSPGGTLNYSIRVNNTGNATATNVTVKETYDGNVTFVTSVPAPLLGNDTWQFPAFNVSETRWINISVTVNASVLNGTVLHNIVNVTCDEGVSDSDTENTTVFVAPVPALEINKTDNPDPVSPGGTLNYSISVNNTGNATATNVTVMETYDGNVTFVRAVPAPSSGDDTWQFATLNASETRWINISVTVNASVPNGTVLHNIVNVSCDEGVTDSDTEDTTVFVAPALPPNITSFAPPSPVSDVVCNWRTFNVTVDQTVNVSWYLNNTLQHTNVSTKEASYTLHAVVVGEHNVSAIASNANGTDMQTWVWNVTVAPEPVLEITKTDVPDPVSPAGALNYTIRVNNAGNATATSVTVKETYDENVTFVAAEPAPSSGDDTWQFATLNASETRWINISVTVKASVLNGTVLHNIVNVSCDEGVTDTDTEDTTVFVAPALPPKIISFAPPSPVNDTVCNWRTFNVTVDQTVNVSWYLNNTLQHTNVSTKEASYTLHAEVVGEHNVSAIASNGNGTDMQTWVWNILQPTDLPDLVIADKWEREKNCLYSVYFVVKNIGTATAPRGHYATLYVDGEEMEHKLVPKDLKPGESYKGRFRTRVELTGDSDTIKVCADNDNDVEESDEDNNCLENEWTCEVGKPDLVIADKYEKGMPDGYNVFFVVENVGTATAPGGHYATLYVDGEEMEHKLVPRDLEPGESYKGRFRAKVKLTGDADTIKVCADNDNDVDEADETNNCLENVWP